MKKKLKLLSLTFLSFATGIATITSTVAWFKYGSSISFGTGNDVYLEAGTEAFYFGGGDGTAEHPYIISNRTHLYNLAWLQYIGYFNTTKDDNGNVANWHTIKAPNFVITADIDMEGITLPPIGTEVFPFFGTIDGGGYTISNLTVSNDTPDDSSDFGSMRPASIPEYAQVPKVVGFFGAVGNIPTNTVLVPDDYSSKAVSVSNLTLDSITIKSRTSEVLIGLAAGYVDGNLSGVKVDGESKLEVNQVDESNPVALHITETSTITNKLSDYGLVGYTTKTGSYGDFKQKLSKYFDSDEDNEGGGDEWGGSVDMASVFARLGRQYGKTNSNGPYQYNYIDNYLNEVKEGQTQESKDTNSTESLHRVNSFSTGGFAGSYNITHPSSSKYYIYGGTYLTSRYMSDGVTFSGYYIKDHNGNYLTVDTDGNISNTTIQNSANVWWFERNGSTATIYTKHYQPDSLNFGNYYLRSGTGHTLELTFTQAQATNWTIDDDGDDLSIVYDGYHIIYRDNVWKLVSGGYGYDVIGYTTYYYVEYPGTTRRYLNIGTAHTNYYDPANGSADSAQHIHFSIDSSNHLYFIYNNTTYYLTAYCAENNRSASIRLATASAISNSTRYGYFSSDTLTARITYNNRNQTYYLRYNTGWTCDTQNRSVVLSEGQDPVYNVIKNDNTLDDSQATMPFRKVDSSPGKMRFTAEDTTYFPINAYSENVTDETGKVVFNQDDPMIKNTGYIVGGTTDSTFYTSNSGDDVRSIIFSQYDRDDKIGKSVNTNGTFKDDIKTIDGTGAHTLSTAEINNFKRYNSDSSIGYVGSKEKLENLFKKTPNDNAVVSGMHFSAQDSSSTFAIGPHNVVNAKNTSINGVEHKGDDTYPLPVYSIDFNLKQQGYINFFSGTYNGGSTNTGSVRTSAATLGADHINSFFSLHKVYRNKTTNAIEDIREIKGIYAPVGNDTDYTYSYKKYKTDGTYDVVSENPNVAFDDDGLTLLFNTDWIGYRGLELQQTDTVGYLYYFEIPMNAGEFCLGNVVEPNQKTEGCYLIYLDIGASGAEDTDHITGYTITTEASPELFPYGVDFAITGIGNKGGETVCVYIPASTSGSIVFVTDDHVDTEQGTDEKDTIDVTDNLLTGHKSTYSYVSSAEGSTFDLDESSLAPPGTYVKPDPGGGIRVSHIQVDTVSKHHYSILLVDVVDSDGEITSTTISCVHSYTNENNQTVTENINYNNVAALIQGIDSVDDYIVSRIRSLITAVSLTRKSTTVDEFDASLPDLPWSNSATTYIIEMELPEGYQITVGAIDNTYTVKINGRTVTLTASQGSTHVSGTYTEPAS